MKASINAGVDAKIAEVKEIYQYYDPWQLKHLIKDLEAFRADAWARLAERRPEAEKLYKQESEEVKAALKQILWDLTNQGNFAVQEF